MCEQCSHCWRSPRSRTALRTRLLQTSAAPSRGISEVGWRGISASACVCGKCESDRVAFENLHSPHCLVRLARCPSELPNAIMSFVTDTHPCASLPLATHDARTPRMFVHPRALAVVTVFPLWTKKVVDTRGGERKQELDENSASLVPSPVCPPLPPRPPSVARTVSGQGGENAVGQGTSASDRRGDAGTERGESADGRTASGRYAG